MPNKYEDVSRKIEDMIAGRSQEKADPRVLKAINAAMRESSTRLDEKGIKSAGREVARSHPLLCPTNLPDDIDRLLSATERFLYNYLYKLQGEAENWDTLKHSLLDARLLSDDKAPLLQTADALRTLKMMTKGDRCSHQVISEGSLYRLQEKPPRASS
jgi:hypothetical protein